MKTEQIRICSQFRKTAISIHFLMYTAISIKVVHEQSGKVEYERERLLRIALKMH